MYADDTVLLSEDVDDLQKMINSVNICSNEYGLYINLLKTKIVIFRNRGDVKAEEKWFFYYIVKKQFFYPDLKAFSVYEQSYQYNKKKYTKVH
jgi:hypothetical protein